MKTINHEYYVSIEIAKLLKEAGFDWEVEYVYNFGKLIRSVAYPILGNELAAPTIEVAQRWLREVKGIYIEITVIENKRAVTNSDGWTFHYEYGKPTFDCDIKDERCENMCTLYDSFDTYEEALETGIKKALKIILEKGE